MSKIRKMAPFFPVALFAIAALSGCSNDSKGEKKVLRVLNSEDYIYECEQNEYWCEDCEDYINRNLVKEGEDDDEVISKLLIDNGYSPKVMETSEYITNIAENTPCNSFVTSIFEKKRLFYCHRW